MPKVTRKAEIAHPTIPFMQVTHQLQGAIATAIIDQNQLDRPIHTVHYGAETAIKLRQRGFLIKDWNDERIRGLHGHLSRGSIHSEGGSGGKWVLDRWVRRRYQVEPAISMPVSVNAPINGVRSPVRTALEPELPNST